MSDFNTLYKLMILYMLSKVDFSLTNAQFSSFFLDKGYTDYFTVQSVLSELTASDLIHQEVVQNTSYYTITPAGKRRWDILKTTSLLPSAATLMSI